MDLVSILWIVAGFVLVLLEFAAPGFVIFFFGAGALITGILSWLIPGLSSHFLLQALLWLGSSAATLVALRRRLSKIFTGKSLPAGASEDDDTDLGKNVEVAKRVAPDAPGRIRLHGTTWEARTFDEVFEEGEQVQIIKREGMTYYVTGAFLESDLDPHTEGKTNGE